MCDLTTIERCPGCGGDGGHAMFVDIDRNNGAAVEAWYVCVVCDGKGSVEEPVVTRTLEDMEEEEADGFVFAGA